MTFFFASDADPRGGLTRPRLLWRCCLGVLAMESDHRRKRTRTSFYVVAVRASARVALFTPPYSAYIHVRNAICTPSENKSWKKAYDSSHKNNINSYIYVRVHTTIYYCCTAVRVILGATTEAGNNLELWFPSFIFSTFYKYLYNFYVWTTCLLYVYVCFLYAGQSGQSISFPRIRKRNHDVYLQYEIMKFYLVGN